MSLRVAIQMDPVSAITPQTDSTLLLAAEAHRRGHRLYHYRPAALGWHADGRFMARGHALAVTESPPALSIGAEEWLDLGTMDAVLMRQDPPFDLSYIAATHILERLPRRVAVFNDPASVRGWPEKILPLDFPGFSPPTLLSGDRAQIGAFRDIHRDIVLKPVFGHGGHGVFHVPPDSDNFDSLVEYMLARHPEGIIAQKYLPAVRQGDKRIILIHGAPAGAFLRVPGQQAGSDFRANLRTGARAEAADLTAREEELCAALAPVLRARGLFFAGIDVIGGWLTEINITSPTGLRTLKDLYGTSPEAALWDVFEAEIAERRRPGPAAAP